MRIINVILSVAILFVFIQTKIYGYDSRDQILYENIAFGSQITNAFFIGGDVVQAGEEITLVRCGIVTFEQKVSNKQIRLRISRLQSIDTYHNASEQIRLYEQIYMPEKTVLIGVYGIENVADDEEWNGPVWYVGIYKYASINGSIKTIRSFATSPQLAEQMRK